MRVPVGAGMARPSPLTTPAGRRGQGNVERLARLARSRCKSMCAVQALFSRKPTPRLSKLAGARLRAPPHASSPTAPAGTRARPPFRPPALIDLPSPYRAPRAYTVCPTLSPADAPTGSGAAPGGAPPSTASTAISRCASVPAGAGASGGVGLGWVASCVAHLL